MVVWMLKLGYHKQITTSKFVFFSFLLSFEIFVFILHFQRKFELFEIINMSLDKFRTFTVFLFF